MKKLIVVPVLALVLSLSACNGYSVASTTSRVIGAILQVAAAEEPNLPAVDQGAFTSFVTLGQTLNAQLGTCLTAANSSTLGKSGKFLACFNTFASGLNSPSELTALRLLSPATQAKVQLYITGIVTGVNVAVAAFGGAQAATPTVSQVQPTPAQLQQLAVDAHVDEVLSALRN